MTDNSNILLKLLAIRVELDSIIDQISNSLDDTPLIKKQVLKAIENAGIEGRRLSHLYKYCRRWKPARKEQQDEVIQSLVNDGLIVEVKYSQDNKVGRKPSTLLVSTKYYFNQ